MILALCGAGNGFFKNGDYRNAIAKYSDAIAADPNNHTYWSNRSASYAGLMEWEEAAHDAAECIKVNKNFVKGYFRLATAKKNLNELDAAADVIKARKNLFASLAPQNDRQDLLLYHGSHHTPQRMRCLDVVPPIVAPRVSLGTTKVRGLCVEPRNADLKKNLKEIDELIRGEKVARHACGLWTDDCRGACC
ncbi:unnamed protein product [Ectocarpus sp. CCAP 1310/34]|nr:unnamed protein product [Ectocarpus sp. CCAP 1310/34]